MKVTKTLEITKEGEWLVASSPNADRDKDRINPLGIKTESFERNPVLFYGHNYHDPWAVIGRIPEFIRSGSDFRFKPELRAAANDADPMNIVKLLWDSKLLNASSIGFMPIKGSHNDIGGIDYDEIELLEISLVPLPANQDALRLAMKALDNDNETVKKDFTDFIEQKRGRVLSSRNEELIRGAYASLETVLSSIGVPEEPGSEPDMPEDEPMQENLQDPSQKDTETTVSDALPTQTQDPAEPPIADPSHDESEAALEAFAKALINLTENWSK